MKSFAPERRMNPSSSLLLERIGPVARLTLNRPAHGNAIDVPLARTLLEAAIACDTDIPALTFTR